MNREDLGTAMSLAVMTYVRAGKIDFLASVQNFVVWHKSESQKVYLWSKLKKSSLFDAHLEIPSKYFINIAQGPGAEWTAEWRQLRSIIVKTRNAIYISNQSSHVHYVLHAWHFETGAEEMSLFAFFFVVE